MVGWLDLDPLGEERQYGAVSCIREQYDDRGH